MLSFPRRGLRPNSIRAAVCALAFGTLATLAGHAQGKVILFGVDGLATAGIEQASTPNIHALMKSGAWSMKMRAVRETSSAPNWASMIMGSPVELNGVTSNGWHWDGKKDAWTDGNVPYPPACESAPGSGIYPTVLGQEHEQHPNAKIGFFTDWKMYAYLFERSAATKIVERGTAHDGINEHDDIFNQALSYLESDRPDVLVIHQDQVDDAGHGKGWLSPEYLAAVEDVDAKLGRLLATLDRLGLRKKYTVILVADHGGKGKHHGGDTIEQIQIPWIISGPGVKQDYEIKTPALMTYDTAATMARVLKVKPSPCWRGVSIDDAFTKKK